MQNKKELIGADGKKVLLAGINKMANAVKSTLGPMGRNVLIQDEFGNVTSTKDGVTVARNLELLNNLENVAARVLREVSMKTNEIAGDGTTTATVLAQAIINVGFDRVESGENPIVLKRDIDSYVDKICAELDNMSINIDLKSDLLEGVASIAANNDPVLGNLLAHAFREVGESGIVTVVAGKGLEDTFEHSNGISINRGYTSVSFVNNEGAKSWEAEGVNIILVGEKITSVDGIFELLSKCIEATQSPEKNFLLICDDIDEKVLSLFVLNKVQGKLNICVVKGPGHNLDRADLLEDLGVFVGGTVLSSISGNPIHTSSLESIGYADSVKVTFNNTTIIGGKKIDVLFDKRVSDLKEQVENTEEEFTRKKIEERIARLKSGIGVIYAGGASNFEVKEKMDRLEDAVHALKGAISDGVLPGGGISLINAVGRIQAIGMDPVFGNKEESFNVGSSICIKAIHEPFIQMLVNAGMEQTAINGILQRVMGSNNINSGYNVAKGRFSEDMIADGVIDVTKVLKAAIRNAGSVAGLFLTTEFVIVNSDYQSEVF